MKKDKLNTEAYKGVRDFYPEDFLKRQKIFDSMRKIAKLYGYEEYDASILEPAELYKNKTSEEIVNEQTYTFLDRGEREITLRPEITPTVARMIAGKKHDLIFPVRWFSIPNLFRYERQQKGRFREHWQFNADIFGLSSLDAETEIISLARDILIDLGLKDNDFLIKLNSRVITDFMFGDFLNLDKKSTRDLVRLIDKKAKISLEEFETKAEKILGRKDDIFLSLVNSNNFEEFSKHLPENELLKNEVSRLKMVIDNLANLGIYNIMIDPSLMRGFDYYTGMVFEFFDTDNENPRSLLGGGRYDKLLSVFGEDEVPTIGFGMGDAVLSEALKARDLLKTEISPAKINLCVLDEKSIPFANELAQNLRSNGLSVLVDYSLKKVGEQIKKADKRKIKFILCLGEKEIETGEFVVKELSTGEENSLSLENLIAFLKAN